MNEYHNLLSMFVRNDTLNFNDLNEIRPTDLQIHKRFDEVGGWCENQLAVQSLSNGEARVLSDVLIFLIELCCQIRLSSSSIIMQS